MKPERIVFPLCIAAMLVTLAGCADVNDRLVSWRDSSARWTRQATTWPTYRWAIDYEHAEAIAARRHAPIIFYFAQGNRTGRGPVEDMLAAQENREMVRDHVLCHLFDTNVQDRRYARQFGVDRAPALIVLHPDGTFHARPGLPSEEQLKFFVRESVPPGERPKVDRLIARKPRYTWIDSIEDIDKSIGEAKKPALIVYHRMISNDWLNLQPLLEDQVVWRNVRHMIHGRVGVMNWGSEDVDTPRFGKLRLPALVLLRPERSYDVLEQPDSATKIAEFVLGSSRDDR